MINVRRVFIGLSLLLTTTIVQAKEYLYIHNTNSGEISKVSIPEHEVVATIEIGFYMDYVNKSPDNTILYVNRIIGNLPGARARNVGESGELIAVDTQTDKELWRMELDGMPHHMAISNDGKRAFIPYYNSWWVAVVDLEKKSLIKKIWIGNGGHGTELSADGKRLYVGSMMNDSLTVIDTDKLEVAKVYHFRDGVRPFAFPKDESVLYVQQSWLHGFIKVDPSTDQQTTIHLPDLGKKVPPPSAYPHNMNHGIGLTPDEKQLWVVGSVLNFVAVYEHPSLKHVANIPVGKDPNALVFSGDGNYAYVSNRQGDDLSVINVKTYQKIKRIPLGKYPQRMVVIDVAE
jgi:YVTN family beta-propeller protein